MYEKHDLPRASLIYLSGGINSIIQSNTVKNQIGIYDSLFNVPMVQSLTQLLPENYFISLQVPLIRVTMPEVG